LGQLEQASSLTDGISAMACSGRDLSTGFLDRSSCCRFHRAPPSHTAVFITTVLSEGQAETVTASSPSSGINMARSSSLIPWIFVSVSLVMQARSAN
jgi:hypothetical protein